MNPGIENISATIGINNVRLDFKNINIMSMIIFAMNIIQNAKPKNAVQTKSDGFIKGHNAHRKAASIAPIPNIPIISFPNPCRNVFLLASFAITSCFV